MYPHKAKNIRAKLGDFYEEIAGSIEMARYLSKDFFMVCKCRKRAQVDHPMNTESTSRIQSDLQE
jgi:hypothetical protein